MARLPQQLTLSMMQNRWASILNPVIDSPLINGQLLTDIPLAVGSNSISHRLGRRLKGWIVVGIDGVAQIYDTQASNQMPQLTLTLTSDASVTVALWVF